ncbi:hypothetical protein LguiA_022929 [Lonicera macranthoides]
MVENKQMHQIFITPTSGLNFLMKFCEHDLLIIEIISTKFHKKVIRFSLRIKPIGPKE